MDNFYKRYCELCAKAGKSVSGVAAAVGLSNAAANGWKKGKIPNDTTLTKLSEYFGVTVEYLKTGEEKAPTQTGERSDDELTMQILEALKNADREQREAILTLLTKK